MYYTITLWSGGGYSEYTPIGAVHPEPWCGVYSPWGVYSVYPLTGHCVMVLSHILIDGNFHQGFSKKNFFDVILMEFSCHFT